MLANVTELRSKMANILTPKAPKGKKGKKKGKAAAAAPAAEPAAPAPAPTHAYIYVAGAWEQWKQDLLRHLESTYVAARDDTGAAFPPPMKEVLKGLKAWSVENGHQKMMKKVRVLVLHERVCARAVAGASRSTVGALSALRCLVSHTLPPSLPPSRRGDRELTRSVLALPPLHRSCKPHRSR
jgi:hypothetical protein